MHCVVMCWCFIHRLQSQSIRSTTVKQYVSPSIIVINKIRQTVNDSVVTEVEITELQTNIKLSTRGECMIQQMKSCYLKSGRTKIWLIGNLLIAGLFE